MLQLFISNIVKVKKEVLEKIVQKPDWIIKLINYKLIIELN